MIDSSPIIGLSRRGIVADVTAIQRVQGSAIKKATWVIPPTYLLARFRESHRLILWFLTESIARVGVLQFNIFRRVVGLLAGSSFGSPLSLFIPSVSLI